MRTPIANSLGAVDWDRPKFQTVLVEALKTPTRRTGWHRDPETFALNISTGSQQISG
jgi:hypothetical protein